MENILNEYPINLLVQLLGKTESELRGMDQEEVIKEILNKLKELEETKQDILISGTNIKSINGQSILGNGDLSFSGSSCIDALPTTIEEFISELEKLLK